MRRIFVVFVVLFSINISAQITGTIKDVNGKTLSTVSVYLENSLTGTTSFLSFLYS